MRKIQAELSFSDSNQWERRMGTTVDQLTRQSMDFIHHAPMPRHHRMKVVCLECSTKFSTTSSLPECPGCGGGDIELA